MVKKRVNQIIKLGKRHVVNISFIIILLTSCTSKKLSTDKYSNSDIEYFAKMMDFTTSSQGYFVVKSGFSNGNLMTLEINAETYSQSSNVLENISQFKYLNKLVIDGLTLDSIPKISNLEYLAHVEFNNCNLKGFINFSTFPKNIKVIVLANNNIDSLYNCNLLKNLKKIYVSGNKTLSIDCESIPVTR